MTLCPYCREPAKLVTGKTVYPHRRDLWNKQFYVCDPCEARVGCHPGTINPLGRLANTELRKEKMKAHAVFDPIWKTHRMSRKMAYAWLAKRLNIDVKDCHIGEFDVEQCRRVVAVCKADVENNQEPVK